MDQNQQAAEKPKGGNKRFAIIFGTLIILGAVYGTIKYLHAQKHEETDDAQVQTRISPVIPRVPGYIQEVRVKDNQYVHKGDTLIILDSRDYQIEVEKAEAALVSAQSSAGVAGAGIPVANANITTSQANILTVDAQIDAAKVNVWRTDNDFKRYANLIADHTITQQQYEQALAAKQSAEKELAILQAQKESADKQRSAVSTQKNVSAAQVSVANAGIKQRQADLDAAKLNLSYTVVTAAVDGQLDRVNLQPGQFVQAGQSLFNIIPDNEKWVSANFKETQLTKMSVGQEVGLEIDAFPDHEFKGKVSSFSPATGASLSLLPPDNASGNFVKVVQRVPIRIDFADPSDSLLNKVRTGMNVLVDVHLK
ncbi:membrane fusion protein, multidrug efflux system [bacterium A37T11]|nr:membrane fusion protein, multidrug efflux system [bacterium A37T11]